MKKIKNLEIIIETDEKFENFGTRQWIFRIRPFKSCLYEFGYMGRWVFSMQLKLFLRTLKSWFKLSSRLVQQK